MKLQKLNRSFLALALFSAGIGAAMVGFSGLGYRWNVWGLGLAFQTMTYGAYVGVAGIALGILALLLGLVGRVGTKQHALAALGILVSGLGFYFPNDMRQTASRLPYIHDISTDTADAPAFVDILPMRADAKNPADYFPSETAEPTRTAYPDLVSLTLAGSVADTISKAEAAARKLGWTIVATKPEEGRLEATAITAWWGFKDDIVIRARDNGQGGVTLDARSKSRVGKSDIGANAARLRAFFTLMKS
jgi:uncharacterized protein (DUF1499 family)